jgi:hypothetical protein
LDGVFNSRRIEKVKESLEIYGLDPSENDGIISKFIVPRTVGDDCPWRVRLTLEQKAVDAELGALDLNNA